MTLECCGVVASRQHLTSAEPRFGRVLLCPARRACPGWITTRGSLPATAADAGLSHFSLDRTGAIAGILEQSLAGYNPQYYQQDIFCPKASQNQPFFLGFLPATSYELLTSSITKYL